MGVKRRLTGYSGMRVDWPHIRSIESAISFDFDSVLRGMVTGIDQPYLIRGFDIQIPDAAINASSLQINVSDTAILHSTSAESGTIFTIPAGTAADTINSTNEKVVGAFQNGVPNYVSVELIRVIDPDSTDQTAGWSEAQQAEFQRTVPIGQILDYRYVITTNGFSTNLPLYIVGVSATGAVEYIQNSRTNLFRLGSGGTVPDPFTSFDFGGIDNGQDALSPRREWINENPSLNPNPVTVIPGDDVSAFNYGDFSIRSLKDWMDAIMTRFKEITGSAYWYTDSALLGTPIETFNLWWDAVGSVMTGAGQVSYNLILETGVLTDGALQTQFTDPSILPGDSYVQGATSGNSATLQAFNNNQLVINSLVREDFTYDEVLRNRRVFRVNNATFALDDDSDPIAGERYGILQRLSTAIASAPVSITGWSYAGNEIIITTGSAHGYEVGDYANVTGLETTAPNAGLLVPNGVHLVKEVPSATEFRFTAQYAPLGAVSTLPSAETHLDGDEVHPYLPRFEVTLAEIDGADVLFTVPGHSFSSGDDIFISGITATTNAPNGRFSSITVDIDQKIRVTPGVAPTGTLGLGTSPLCRYDSYTFLMTLEGAAPDTYEKVDVLATAWSDTQLSYTLGSDALPELATAIGAITIDGVVATTTVSNPIQVDTMQGDGAGIITVNTFTNHGFANNPGPISFTIYGDQSLSPYIRTYEDVSITVDSPTQFTITPFPVTGTIVTSTSLYDNPGNESTFAGLPDNPFPGPIQWTSDIIVKGIIGDRFFRIPQTATAAGTAVADRFNVNGLTGTAFLQDGEVAYIELDRGGTVSSGATYSTPSSDTIMGAVPPTDEDGVPLVAGDFVRFESDSESKWLRIAGTFGVPITTNSFTLVSDNGQSPTLEQRPNTSGRLIYAKTTYDQIQVKPHWEVTPSPDIYWLAVRRDNGSSKSRIYFKGLELEQGEVREINDNELSNHLLYTGAKTESAINPNYTVIDNGGTYSATETITVGGNVEDIDTRTRQITFVDGPTLGFQAEDKITFMVGGLPVTYTVNFLVSSRTVIVKEDISDISLNQDVTFIRDNYIIDDIDNLTLALRKTDRENARINTALERPIYDESVFPQQINLAGAGDIRSGSFIYQGTEQNPTALAWVLHGSTDIVETIETSGQTMPGGHPSIGSDAILVHVYSGSFLDGTAIFQNGVNTGRTIDNAGDPEFTSPELEGGVTGIEIVLPPNRRTEVTGSAIVVWPAHSFYKASLDESLSGEELLVIANDSIRQASVDYAETFGGPKSKIRIVRNMPPGTRLRFRIMTAFGSALASLAGNITLQDAYNGGRTISTLAGFPVDISAADANTGGAALNLTGSLNINGDNGTDIVGGIFGPTDQSFLVGSEANKPKEAWKGEDYVKSHAGYTGSAWSRRTGSGTSVGDTATPLSSCVVTIPTGCSARIKMNATARRTDGPLGVASFNIEGTFYNVGAGAVAAGSPATIHLGGDGDGDSYAVSFGIVGDEVCLVVFGTAGSTIQWVTGIDYQIVETST